MALLRRVCLVVILAAALFAWLSWPSENPQAVLPFAALTTQSGPKAASPAPAPDLSQQAIAAAAAPLPPAPQQPLGNTDPEILQGFKDWTQRYLAAPTPEQRAALVGEGISLAKARRPVLKEVIKSNPRHALEEAVPMVTRQQLPPEIVQYLEERVNGRAALRVYQGVGQDNQTPVPTVRVAEFDTEKSYEAHVYGRREEDVRWLANASLNGVAIDSDFAVHEEPFRPLEVGEKPDPKKRKVAVCPVSGETSLDTEEQDAPITEETPALEAYGELVYLCNGSHVTVYREQLIYAEGGTGGPIGFTGVLPASPTPSIGNVRVLVIPMTFADQNDNPSSESKLYEVLRDVGDHYAKASYGKLTLLTTVTPPIKLPHNESWYIQKDTSNGGTIDG
ncbi:MAG: hypothetical protein EOP84_26170, partial [Verrucomicrobiaceae bacterium]